MSLRQFLPTNPKAEAAQSSLPVENDRPPSYTDGADSPNDRTRAQNVSLPGRDSVMLPDETKSSPTDTVRVGVAETSEVTTPRYIYYRIYAEDGAIPLKTPAPGDPFLGRIKARSVAPPHTAQAVKRSIAKVENIKDFTSTSLFLTPYSQSPIGDTGKVAILNRTGPGSTPQEPLAVVAKMSDSEWSALDSESGGRGELASAAEPETTPLGIRYLYYVLYADGWEVPSKVAIDPEEPSLGRIRADSVAPPHSPTSIKRCISRVERTPALAHANLFADISCDTPMKEGHISILHTDCPGLSPNDPLAIVQPPIESQFPDGKYLIKNRTAEIYWAAGPGQINIKTVYLCRTTMVQAKDNKWAQWHITHDTNGNISISPDARSSWVGAEIAWSTVPVPWRLIPADSKFYHLTTDVNRVSRNPRVLTAQRHMNFAAFSAPMVMATLKEDDPCQMWEFIGI